MSECPRRTRPSRQMSAIAAVSAAAYALARCRLGALIVIVGRDAIDELVTTGVRLDGRVSAELLEALFQKGSAVHDGAAIIDDDVVARVGVIVPLTQRTTVPEGYGTRHRAGMGLAERSDALVIVVSEERGEVTLMRGDQIRLMPGESALNAALEAITAAPAASPRLSLRALRRMNLRLPAAALVLSAMVWGLVFLFPGASVRARSVPLEFTRVPAGLTITSQSADTIAIWLRGSDFIFGSVNLDALVARCDLGAAHDGDNVIKVPADAVDLPLGLTVVRVAPRQVIVRLTREPTAPR